MDSTIFSAEASTPISSTHGATNSQERAKSIACATCLYHLYPSVYLLIQCVSCNRQSRRRCKKSMQTKTRKKGGCAWRFSLWVVLQYNCCVERIACSTIYAGQLLYTWKRCRCDLLKLVKIIKVPACLLPYFYM